MAQVTFFVRSNNDKANSYMLYARVRINKRTGELSTEEKVNPNDWDQSNQYFTGKTKEQTEYINLLCDQIKYKLKTTALLLVKENKLLTPTQVIKSYKDGSFVEKPIIIYDIIEKYIQWEADPKNKNLNEKTIAIHERYLKHLKEFTKLKEYYVNDLTEVQAELFKDWFRSPRSTKKRTFIGTINKTTASRHISFYRESLQWGIKKGLIKNHNLLYYEGERDKHKKFKALTSDDLLKLMQFQFASDMLTKIKDLFLFSVATGISYGDLWSDFIIQDTAAGKIITGHRNKGDGNSFFVPYDELAEVILTKYNFKLPKYENGTYNRLLKEIANLVGIDKPMRTHLARKTFATLQISNGWSLTNVKLMMGHTSEKTTELYYVERTADSVIHEMNERKKQAKGLI